MPDDSARTLEPVRALDARARLLTTPCGAGEMCWRIWGDGPPLVLLHGGFGSWQHWIRNIGALSRHVQVIAGDLPGLGDSHEAPQPHTAEGIAEVLHEGIDRILGRNARLSLAGFSLGGAIGAVLAQRLGMRVDQLLLFAPSALGPHWQPIDDRLRRWSPNATDAERLGVVHENLAISMIGDPAKVDALAVGIQDRLLRQKRRLRGMPISTSDAVLRALSGIEAATTIVWGARDVYLQPDVATCVGHVRALHPRVDVHVLPGVGHWVMYEASDAVNALILARVDKIAMR